MRSRASIRARLFFISLRAFSCGPFPHEDETAQWAQRLRRSISVQFGLSRPSTSMNAIRLKTTPSKPKAAAARLYASSAPGPGHRPGSKVRTPFEDAHGFSKVRILENPDDFFEDAHRFARCARKVRIFARRPSIPPARSTRFNAGRTRSDSVMQNLQMTTAVFLRSLASSGADREIWLRRLRRERDFLAPLRAEKSVLRVKGRFFPGFVSAEFRNGTGSAVPDHAAPRPGQKACPHDAFCQVSPLGV